MNLGQMENQNNMNSKKMEENNKYRQGRSEEQIKASYIGAFISIIGLIVIGIIAYLTS